jgi:arylsulfatase A-like enzyme
VLTGLYPRSHDVAAEVQKGAEPDLFGSLALAPSRWTLAEALRARGYRTGGFVDTYWLSPLFGVRQGFDEYRGEAALAPLDDVTKGIQLIVEELVPRWLDGGKPGRPPFLFVHALDAHGPYWPEEPFHDRFHAELGPERTLAPAGSMNQTWRAIPAWMGHTLWPREDVPMPEEMPVEEIVARYDETLLKVDHYLGELFALLRARELYDDAVIVITGDHGETFGPGVWGHGVMREDVLHVPLILKLPAGAHAGKRIAEPVSLVDLYPTLLALAGVPPEPSWLHGSSLLARIEGAAGDAERPLYSEGGHVEQYALTVGRWRLVEEHPGSESGEYSLLTHPRVPASWLEQHFPEVLAHPLTEERMDALRARPGFAERIAELRALVAGPYHVLHDLEADRDERRDLAAERPDVVRKLLPLLEQERARSRRAREDASGLVVPELGAEALQAQDELGYGGGGK